MSRGTLRLSVPAGEKPSATVAMMVPANANTRLATIPKGSLFGLSAEPGSSHNVRNIAMKLPIAIAAEPSQERVCPKKVY